MKVQVLSVLGVMLLTGTAQAGLITETEFNNNPGAANALGAFNVPGDSLLVDGSITPGLPPGGLGDVDWFQFTVVGPTQLVSATFGVPSGAIGDSVLTLYAGDGTTILNQDDNSGINNFSALEQVLAPGNYFLVVSGAPDFGNQGFHTELFNYKLTIGSNIIPAPGALALLGAAGLISRRRRR